MTVWYIAIPAVAIAFSALFVLARVVRHRNAARPAGRHENGHTVHDGLPPAARRLPSARGRAAALADLAEPCPACGVDHNGDCVAGTLPAHLRPGVVLPATPKLALAPALEPLPSDQIVRNPVSLVTDEELADIKERFDAAMKERRPTAWLPPERDLTITAGPGADEAYQDVVNAGMHDARRRPGGQTTGEIFEHLCEGTGCWCHSFRRLPAAVVRELKHETVDEAVASIVLHAKEAAEFRAELEARLAEDDVAHADGQVTHG
jgi:hypothetical protein